MTDQDKLIYGLMFSLIGISMGWILNQISGWYKSRILDKRNLKKILFILLETNFLIGQSNFHLFTKIIITSLNKVAPNPNNKEEALKIVKQLVETTITTLLEKEIFKKYKSAKSKYLEAIDKYAEIDPVEAYYLKGNTNAVEIFEKFKPIVLKINDSSTPEEGLSAVTSVMQKLSPEFFEETIKGLEKDILQVAKRINWITYFKSKKAIKNAESTIEENLENLVKKWIEIFGEHIKESVK